MKTWAECAAAGMTAQEAAKERGVTRSAAYFHAKNYGTKFRRGYNSSDVHPNYKGGAPSSDVTDRPPQRGAVRSGPARLPDLPPPPLPVAGVYDPGDLLSYFAEASRRGMTADDIARALNVPLDRVHYFQGRDGKRALERRAAKMN